MKDDTTQDVVRAGKNASVGLKSMQVALQDAEAITARMQNSEFADRILKFAKKRDLKGLAELLGSATSKSQVQVKSVEDFKIEAVIITDGKQYLSVSVTDVIITAAKRVPSCSRNRRLLCCRLKIGVVLILRLLRFENSYRR